MRSWLDKYSREEIKVMSVIIVDYAYTEGIQKKFFSCYAEAESTLKKRWPTMINRDMMEAMPSTDDVGNPQLRFETQYAYNELCK